MSNRIGALAILALLSSAAACGSSPSPAPSTGGQQVIRGTVALSAYAIDNPVVIAHTSDGRAFFAPIQPTGAFSVTVPSGASVRLAIANTTRSSGYVAISRVLFPGAIGAWARLDGATPSIDLGNVRPATSTGGVAPQDHGGDTSGSSSGSSSGGTSSDPGSSSDGSGGSCPIHACGTTPPGRSELPYDVRPPLGSTFQLDQAFLAKGPLPAAILSVTMDGGGTWRLSELQADAPFVITQADCTHQGNRDVGRDRVIVSWKNADGSTASDHLDLRYCDGSGVTTQSDGSSRGDDSGMEPDDCESDGTPVCASSSEHDSECDGHADGCDKDDDDHDDDKACPAGGGGGSGGTTTTGDAGTTTTGGGNGTTTGGAGGGAAGDACTVNADCGIGLLCVASRCQPQIK